ncbi:hypothetical protein BKA56DRAFT_580114 [Ilyonectria sp. MPI-CAGE-AT-0026]|nr:hypothetical protein BKA56DRAFT_580114 [Ilyonectria sp. MPI-CAGE-AT-0026]
MSPTSEMTMERHHREQAEAAAVEEERRRVEQEASDKEHGLVPFRQRRRRRQSSSPSSSSSSSDDSISGRRRRHGDDDSSSDGAVEMLPDRFDQEGERLDGRSATHHRWTSRRGDFEYRPQHRGGLNVRGAWQVAGTDGEMVERLMRGVSGALEGRKSWLGVLGDVIGSLEGPRSQAAIRDNDGNEDRNRDSDDDDSDDDKRRRRKERRRRR